jgi:hypothetical protein
VFPPRVRHFLVLAALALPAPSAVADVTTPSSDAPRAPAPHPTSMLTRWPAVLPCPQPREASLWSPSGEDVLRWSNASGAEVTLDRRRNDGARPIPPALLRDPPRSLTWTRRGRPHDIGGEMPMPVPRHHVSLQVKCDGDVGQIRWSCDDREASCRPSVWFAYRDPDVQQRHRSDVARFQRVMQAGAGARDLLIADALRLAQEACAGDRCADVVARAVPRLRAAAKQPWRLARPGEHRLEMTAPGAPDENLRCDGADYNRVCTLTLGSLRFTLHGDDKFSGYEGLDGDKWEVAAYWFGYSIADEAMR